MRQCASETILAMKLKGESHASQMCSSHPSKKRADLNEFGFGFGSRHAGVGHDGQERIALRGDNPLQAIVKKGVAPTAVSVGRVLGAVGARLFTTATNCVR